LVFAANCHRAPEEPVATTSTSTNLPTSAAPAACPPDPEPKLAPLPVAQVSFPEASQGPAGSGAPPVQLAKVEAELVQNDHDVERGLMYRRSMPGDHGMLFVLDRRDHTFWMHNTCIPLDMLYIDDGVIVGIVENAPPLNDDVRSVGRQSSWVLELNGGWCKAHGVRTGQKVVLPGAAR